MDKIWHALILLCLTSLLPPSAVRCLHLKLIHTDSIHSPLYPGNLTSVEKLQRMSNYSDVRAKFYETMLSSFSYSEEQIRPRVVPLHPLYIVEVFIGTPSNNKIPKRFFLAMETGSNLVWLQCEPCKRCWSERTELFNPKQNSTTFAEVPCDHPLCDLKNPGRTCNDRKCYYTYNYVLQGTTKGLLGLDTFSFASDGPRMEQIQSLVFGCGLDNQGFKVSPHIAGFIGLNMQPSSLISQLQKSVGLGQFSYCLQYWLDNDNDKASSLRFGRDAFLQNDYKFVSFIPVPGSSFYYLPLEDVIIDNRRIGFEPQTFEPKKVGPTYRGGFIIDSGATCTLFMSNGPYERVMKAFKDYFAPLGLTSKRYSSFDMCYSSGGQGLSKYPSMKFRFENWNEIEVQSTVAFGHGSFCVAVQRNDRLNVWGAHQQQNYRISYDIESKALTYKPANCAQEV